MSESTVAERISENWKRVREQVAEAAIRSSRAVDSVKIIGVTKYVDTTLTKMLVAAGCLCLGENRPQSLCQKAQELSDSDLQWHQIGHVQRNKVKRLLDHVSVIQTIDSQRILTAIAEEARRRQSRIQVMLEVNISRDESKTGLLPDELRPILNSIPQDSIEVIGVMGMAGLGTDASQARKQFAEIRMLRDEVASEMNAPLPELSMGMSGDFQEAIAEGATMVRIGSKLFEGVRS